MAGYVRGSWTPEISQCCAAKVRNRSSEKYPLAGGSFLRQLRANFGRYVWIFRLQDLGFPTIRSPFWVVPRTRILIGMWGSSFGPSKYGQHQNTHLIPNAPMSSLRPAVKSLACSLAPLTIPPEGLDTNQKTPLLTPRHMHFDAWWCPLFTMYFATENTAPTPTGRAA